MFRRHGDAYRRTHDGHLGRVERRVMSSVELCRTAALGGHPRPVPIAASCAAPTTPAAPALPEVPEGGARRVAGRPLGFIPVLGYVDDLTPCRSGSLSLFRLIPSDVFDDLRRRMEQEALVPHRKLAAAVGSFCDLAAVLIVQWLVDTRTPARRK